MTKNRLERRIEALEIEKSPVIRTWVDLMNYCEDCEDPRASFSTEMAQLIRECP